VRDRTDKKRIYARSLHVSAYYIYDPFTHQLDGYALHERDYRPLVPDAAGRLECAPLGLSLGVAPSAFKLPKRETVAYLRWFDGEGTMLLDPEEMAEAEAERAQAEGKRADAEANRADAEARRADAEATRAADLQARLAAYEQAFGLLPKG
jgi:hypothetical protein